MILYVEDTVDANDLPVALWRFCNNVDPRRDHTLVQWQSGSEPGRTLACMGFDGTTKTRELDNFQRDMLFEIFTLGKIDRAHSAAPDFADDFVIADTLAFSV